MSMQMSSKSQRQEGFRVLESQRRFDYSIKPRLLQREKATTGDVRGLKDSEGGFIQPIVAVHRHELDAYDLLAA